MVGPPPVLGLAADAPAPTCAGAPMIASGFTRRFIAAWICGTPAVRPLAYDATMLRGQRSSSVPGPSLAGLWKPRKFLTVSTTLLAALPTAPNIFLMPLM